MAARTYGAESLAYLLAANMDRGMGDYQLEVSECRDQVFVLVHACALI